MRRRPNTSSSCSWRAAPSQLDLFDHKPLLQKHDGEEIPAGIIPEGERFAFVRGTPRLLGSPFEFRPRGQSGNEISELLPFLQQHADEIAIIRSMKTTQFNHAPAQIFMNTGHQVIGRPSMGSWLSYGLGSDNQDLPAFVVLMSGENNPDGGKSCWGSGFLPTVHQGVEFRAKGEPVLFSRNPDGVDSRARRESLDLIRSLNTLEGQRVGDPETTTRIAAYEMAYRMQSSVPELTDISGEPAATHELYGTDPGQVSFGNNCLLARRLVERGVRFVQLYHRGWDTHGAGIGNDIVVRVPQLCLRSRPRHRRVAHRPEAARAAGSTAGDLGRRVRPDADQRSAQRIQAAAAVTTTRERSRCGWPAAASRPGTIIGQTDDFGYNIVEDPVHVHDLHATMLHLMGIDHEKLTYQLPGPRFPADRRGGQGREAAAGIATAVAQTFSLPR